MATWLIVSFGEIKKKTEKCYPKNRCLLETLRNFRGCKNQFQLYRNVHKETEYDNVCYIQQQQQMHRKGS